MPEKLFRTYDQDPNFPKFETNKDLPDYYPDAISGFYKDKDEPGKVCEIYYENCGKCKGFGHYWYDDYEGRQYCGQKKRTCSTCEGKSRVRCYRTINTLETRLADMREDELSILRAYGKV